MLPDTEVLKLDDGTDNGCNKFFLCLPMTTISETLVRYIKLL